MLSWTRHNALLDELFLMVLGVPYEVQKSLSIKDSGDLLGGLFSLAFFLVRAKILSWDVDARAYVRLLVVSVRPQINERHVLASDECQDLTDRNGLCGHLLPPFLLSACLPPCCLGREKKKCVGKTQGKEERDGSSLEGLTGQRPREREEKVIKLMINLRRRREKGEECLIQFCGSDLLDLGLTQLDLFVEFGSFEAQLFELLGHHDLVHVQIIISIPFWQVER